MANEDLIGVLKAAWELVRDIEPASGASSAATLSGVRAAIDRLAIARDSRRRSQANDEDAAELDEAIARVYGRAAAVAIAGGDEANAERWLTVAEELARGEQRTELAAARRSHERYRALVHGRYLMVNWRRPEANAIWKKLTKGESDPLAAAAAEALKAPQPLGPGDSTPTLHRVNGIGAGFYGRRDYAEDGSYVTTHCFSVLWVPLIALSAWRVQDEGGGYRIFAREQLSSFARISRLITAGAIALVIAGLGINSYLSNPERLAGKRWDAAVEAAQGASPEAALKQIDAEIERDGDTVDRGRLAHAGAEVVRLTASYVGQPFTADKVEQAIRVIRRYQALPERAKVGAAEDALFELVDRWTQQLGNAPEAVEPRLALQSAAAEVATGARKVKLDAEVIASRGALAVARQADWPLDALAILIGSGATQPSLVKAADAIVERLAESPSLLLDAGADLDAWIGATTAGELRDRISKLRDDATAGRTAAEAEGVTPKQLAAMQSQRPWDQHVVLQLAHNDASAGKLDAAAARLTKLGPPGMMIRGARFVLAQLAASQGKLDDADAQLGALLGTRVQRFAAASAALRDAGEVVDKRVQATLKAGTVSRELERKYMAASTDDERKQVITDWEREEFMADKPLAAARARYVALGDVVPMALAAGSIKLRRAQGMSGPARDRMLHDAERTFLAIRSEAEGQPKFRLALGEIYARLGKTTESDAEFAAVLAHNDPELTQAVASVYRDIGSLARAKQIATGLYNATTSTTPAAMAAKMKAANLLAVMSDDDDEAEQWLRKSDLSAPYIRASLLEAEAKRLRRQGKTAECAAKAQAAAKAHLAIANPGSLSAYNNAAVADELAFSCSSDPQALRDAAAALEIAYRNAPDDPIVVANLGTLLRQSGELRVLGRRIDARALRLDQSQVGSVISMLLDTDRVALLAELAADPSIRRSSEILAQYEILAPNSPAVYLTPFADAVNAEDAAAAAAIVERARHAKALDVSQFTEARARWIAGTDDAKMFAELEQIRARFEAALGRPGLDPRTRAVGNSMVASSLRQLGLYRTDKALLAQARDAAAKAMQLWPVLDLNGTIIATLIDDAGIDADPKAWIAARRVRSHEAALAKLVDGHDPLAAKLLAAKSWSSVAGYLRLRLGHRKPDLDDLRLARVIGDPALEVLARPVLDNKLVRLGVELAIMLDPTGTTATEDLAYLKR